MASQRLGIDRKEKLRNGRKELKLLVCLILLGWYFFIAATAWAGVILEGRDSDIILDISCRYTYCDHTAEVSSIIPMAGFGSIYKEFSRTATDDFGHTDAVTISGALSVIPLENGVQIQGTSANSMVDNEGGIALFIQSYVAGRAAFLMELQNLHKLHLKSV